MSLMRWEPFREVEAIKREMNRLFDTLAPTTYPNGERTSLYHVPAAEMTETADAVHLKVEVPGLEAKDIDIEVTADSVSISGERQSETKTQEAGMTRTEFRYGKFRRVIALPTRIENTKVTADYKNGILHLTLPKAAAEKQKVVKVNLGQ
ncbi:molecular chaperone [Hydrococcus rivularis NIES-593]|uniref:Molecular chaperone n=1 Tax=Hydrococcus rivularis NIES-593 TaxID=1921803 RepID=A0A1U7HEJ4_9CYAN|nr:Hsp20/alpha crystallin family protein [Hydrococcus rivularis]OKH21996.1 molecular chaperone [Hydrococcus rivularis NIES-593]